MLKMKQTKTRILPSPIVSVFVPAFFGVAFVGSFPAADRDADTSAGWVGSGGIGGGDGPDFSVPGRGMFAFIDEWLDSFRIRARLPSLYPPH
jgi:hypothetical protein